MSDDKTRILNTEDMARLAVPADSDDGRTRVLSAEETERVLGGAKAAGAPKSKAAAAVEDQEPKFSGSKIVFFCSNGHKITVDRSLAGKHGKCQGMARQGCGVAFVVPVPPDFEPEPAEGASADAPAETLAFDGGPPADEAVEGAAATGWTFGAESPPEFTEPSDAPEPGSAAEPVGWGIDIDEIDNPTARLVARLWLERAHGGIVEVHLSGGSVIMPEWYEPRWSCGTHALFAAQAADGSLTLTAVAWDQIQKVVVRQVQGTPDGMFEG